MSSYAAKLTQKHNSQGSNTLRGGARTFGAKTLVGNWGEDRRDPRFPGAYHGAQTEYEERNQQVARRKDKAFGAALLAQLDDNKTSQHLQNKSIIGPDSRCDAKTWKSVGAVSFTTPSDEMENTTKIMLETVASKDKYNGKALRAPPNYTDEQLKEYSQRWLNDASKNSSFRFQSTQSASFNEAASKKHVSRPTRILPGTPKSFELFRDKILATGGMYGIRAMGRTLQAIDAIHDNATVSRTVFHQVLKDFGLEFTVDEEIELVQYLDRAKDKMVNTFVFYEGLRGTMNQSRKEMIQMAWNTLCSSIQEDASKDQLPVEKVCSLYDPQADLDVQSGRINASEALKRFEGEWKRCKRQTGFITFDQFMAYYRDISAAIDDDDDLEDLIRNSWHIPRPDDIDPTCTTSIPIIVTHENGQKSIETIRKHKWLCMTDKKALKEELRIQRGIENVLDVKIDF